MTVMITPCRSIWSRRGIATSCSRSRRSRAPVWQLDEPGRMRARGAPNYAFRNRHGRGSRRWSSTRGRPDPDPEARSSRRLHSRHPRAATRPRGVRGCRDHAGGRPPGTWAMAQELAVADIVVPFEAFPRNSSEAEVDVHATAAVFQAAMPDEYDLAIDLRVDHDTPRAAPQDAGQGEGRDRHARAFSLPRHLFCPSTSRATKPETAREEVLTHYAFEAQGSAPRSTFPRDVRTPPVSSATVRSCGGPYWRLRPGNYIFEPHIELGAETKGGRRDAGTSRSMRGASPR